MRRDQKEMVKVLQVFAEICKEHDIKWWLCSGTLLGAARHGGFIPWDDDIDVSMMKKDYKKLLKILRISMQTVNISISAYRQILTISIYSASSLRKGKEFRQLILEQRISDTEDLVLIYSA